jgi:amino acid transporter
MAAVGFESAASLGDEARNPLKNIPRVIVASGIIAGFYYVLNAYAMIAGFHAIFADMARSQTPALDVARSNGVALLAVLLTLSGLVTGFSVVLASIVAGARTLFQLAQHGVLPTVFRHVHARNRTPDAAIHAATVIALAVVVPMTLAGIAPRAIWDYAGTICTFGFLLAYLLLSVGAPIYLHRNGSLRPAHLAVALLAIVAVSIPLVSSIYPIPDYPHNLMIYIFVALLAAGMGWFFALRWRRPAIDAEITGHLKTTYQRFALERTVDPNAVL